MKSLRNPEHKQELLQRIQNVRPDSPRQWGKMSAHQMICHLADGYRLYLGEIPAEPVPGPAIVKTMIRTFALYAPVPWPRGKVPTLPAIDQVAGGWTSPSEFAKDVGGLYAMLERFAQIPQSYQWRHPGLGPMSYSQVMRLGYLHADHHLRQFGA
ncbi:MAG TPA: hypothetical protein VN025_11855 [Candidatus Dormibacteraeota bacterium]|jgi:hypothetical protein|nr:hypothetical protein [Candidatus Dormibacteraeota bacterium]